MRTKSVAKRKQRGSALDRGWWASYNRGQARSAQYHKASPIFGTGIFKDTHHSGCKKAATHLQREDIKCISISALQLRRGMTMSLEVFEKLEAKVQQAIDTITLLQMEIEELKEKNNSLAQDVQSAQQSREELERENHQLREQQHGWQERLQALLGRMEEV